MAVVKVAGEEAMNLAVDVRRTERGLGVLGRVESLQMNLGQELASAMD